MRKRIFYHIAFWVLYVLYKSYLNFDPSSFGINGIGVLLEIILVQLVFVTIKIPLVYTLFYVTDKFLSKQWSVFKACTTVTVIFTMALFCFILVNQRIVYGLIYKEKTDDLWTSIHSLKYKLLVLYLSICQRDRDFYKTNSIKHQAKNSGAGIIEKEIRNRIAVPKSTIESAFSF